MGQSVSTDADAMELKEFLRLGCGGSSGPSSSSATQDAGLGAVGHHIKAWKFDSQGRTIVDTPVDLCDKSGLFTADLQRNSSYLILHVRPSKACAGTCDQGAAVIPSDELEELRASLGATCTPRGLAVEVASHDDGVGRNELVATAMRYAVFVWHGLAVDPLVKAYTMGKAFELDRLLRHGLLRQPAFLEGISRGITVRGISSHDAGQQAARQQLPKDGRQVAGNRLLSSLLDCVQRGAQSVVNASATLRPVGTHRFPHLGLSVCKAVGRSSVHSQQVASGTPGSPFGVVTGVGSAAANAQSATRVKGIAIPRLALGGLTSLQGVVPESIPAAMSTTDAVDQRGGSDCKRFKGSDVTGTPPPARSPAEVVARPALVGRPGLAPLPLQQCLGEPTQRGPQPVEVPSLNLAALGNHRQPPRADAPVMLNLEEIQMSEEDLAGSYDPNNEENNYHLPHHLYMQLKLNHFRKECSEVIAGKLFISSFQVAGDLERLQQVGITHIVNAAGDICENKFLERFHYLTYYLKDVNSEDISLLFYKTLEWIDSVLDAGGRVLVHCREGVSRSATIVIAFLMWKFDLTFDAAHERLRKIRPICNPNTGFTCQLLRFAKKLNGTKASLHEADGQAPHLFRVAPYHPKEPFLLVLPVDSSFGKALDPRFGWVLHYGTGLTLWMGSKIPDRQAVTAAVSQHVKWLDVFEKTRCTLHVLQEGQETLDFWQALARAAPEVEEESVAIQTVFDPDFDVLSRLGTAGSSEDP